ncbi:MAG: UvrD-helicase domain-containing protein [Deltaproteobacteria bacterium]|nr:UvrD-helicase domain-containing protein [Deltaproteobacteria bacterium]
MADLFDPSQVRVLESRSCLCVEAGAGSGKTGTLVERVVRHLEDNPQTNTISSVLVLTFSEKAAAELRERVTISLRTRLLEAKKEGHLNQISFWERELRRMGQAEIGTIHSFALSLVRSQAHLLGLPADAVVGEAEEGDLYEVILDMLNEPDKDLVELLKITPLNAPRGGGLRTWLWSCLQRMSSWGLDSLSSAVKAPAEENLKQLLNDFKREVVKAQELFNDNQIASKYPEGALAIEAMSNLMAPAEEDLSKNFPQLLISLRAYASGLSGLGRAKATKATKESLEISLAALVSYLTSAEAAPFVERLVRLVNLLPEKTKAKRLAKGLLSFDDILILARKLLRENEDIRRNEANRWRLILVDEFQDTNRLQADLIALLLKEPLGPGKGLSELNWAQVEPKLMVVGDAKQSIYRFRAAEPVIMARLSQSLSQGGGQCLRLETNYRTQASLIELFNSFFSYYLLNDYSPQKGLRENLYQSKPAVWLTADDSSRPRARILSAQIQASLIADYLSDLFNGRLGVLIQDKGSGGQVGPLRPPKPGDVAVLLRVKKNAEVYQNAFAARGWPCHTLKGSDLFEAKEIAGLCAAYLFLMDREPELNLAVALCSPFGPVSEAALCRLVLPKAPFSDRKKLSDYFQEPYLPWPEGITAEERRTLEDIRLLFSSLKPLAARRPIGEIIEHLVEERSLLPLLISGPTGTPERVKNIQRFLGLVKSPSFGARLEGQSAVDLLDSHWRQGLEASEIEGDTILGEVDESSINIMTIHRSKGLEFPVVVIPEAESYRGPTEDLMISDDGQLAVRFISRTLEGKVAPVEFEELLGGETINKINEYKRLFYVAATRARDHLVLVGKASKSPNDSWLSKIVSWPSFSDYFQKLESSVEQPQPNQSSLVKSIEQPQIEPSLVSDLARNSAKSTNEAESTKGSGFRPELIKAAPRDRTLICAATSYCWAAWVAEQKGLDFSQAFLKIKANDEDTRFLDQERGAPVGPVGPTAPNLRGELFHAVMEVTDCFQTESGYEDLFSQKANYLGLTPSVKELSFLVSRALAFQQSPLGRFLAETLLDPEGLVMREWPFWLRLESDKYGNSPVIISGIIDLLMIDKNGKGFLVDYKLSSPKENDVYNKQLALYAQAVRQAGLKVDLETRLWFSEAEARSLA